jgi:small multidrug resistance pump
MSVQKIDLGTAYAIWAGMGTTLIVIFSWLFFKEEMNLVKIIGIGLIILGSIILKLQHS